MERKKKYRRWLMAALAVNLLVLSFYLWNWFQYNGAESEYTEPEGEYTTNKWNREEKTDVGWEVSADVKKESSGEKLKEESKEMSEAEDAQENRRLMLMPVGSPAGLYIHTKGVLVLGTGKVTDIEGNVSEPAKTVFKTGDYILKINGNAIHNTSQALALIQSSGGAAIAFDILRDGENMHLTTNPVETAENIYKVGIWLRDDTQGIGTITYIDENQNFAALGHGITDVDTGILMDISHGMVYQSNILSIVKGESGTPGEIVGTIDYQSKNRIGNITANTICGIFGTLDAKILAYDADKALPAARQQEIYEGAAQILCTIEGETKTYDICIEKLNKSSEEHKNFVVRIVDEELLKKTNGILQGMSGSPVIQDGRLVGAVTHVYVNQ